MEGNLGYMENLLKKHWYAIFNELKEFVKTLDIHQRITAIKS